MVASFRPLRLNMSNYWSYLFLCCLISSVFAENNEESTSAIVWVLLVLLIIGVVLVIISLVFITYNLNKRLKTVEYKLARRGSISSGNYHLKDTNSSIRSRSSGRYESNPIKSKRRSRSPRNSLQPEQQQQQPEQYHSAYDNHFSISNNSVYSNLRRPPQEQQQQEHQQYQQPPQHQERQPLQKQFPQQPQLPVSDAAVTHPNESLYEMLPVDIDDTQAPPPSVGTPKQSPVVQEKQTSVPETTVEEPYIPASYITVIDQPTDTITETVTDNSTQEVTQREYSVVPTPPTPNKNERTKIVKRGKRPESSEKYTDPTPNGVAQMRKMKSTSMKQSSPNSSPGERKKRRASDSSRPGFEDWPLKPTSAPTNPPMDESNV